MAARCLDLKLPVAPSACCRACGRCRPACLDQVPEEDLKRVAAATGAAVQTTVNNLDTQALGTCAHFEEVQVCAAPSPAGRRPSCCASPGLAAPRAARATAASTTPLSCIGRASHARPRSPHQRWLAPSMRSRTRITARGSRVPARFERTITIPRHGHTAGDFYVLGRWRARAPARCVSACPLPPGGRGALQPVPGLPARAHGHDGPARRQRPVHRRGRAQPARRHHDRAARDEELGGRRRRRRHRHGAVAVRPRC